MALHISLVNCLPEAFPDHAFNHALIFARVTADKEQELIFV